MVEIVAIVAIVLICKAVIDKTKNKDNNEE